MLFLSVTECSTANSNSDGSLVNYTNYDGSTVSYPASGNTKTLFVNFPKSDQVAVSLVPGSTVKPKESTLVAFGMPFPPETLFDAAKIAVLDSAGNELPSFSKELARWRSLLNNPQPDSIRSVLIFTQITFPDLKPLKISVKYGETPQRKMPEQGDATSTWVPMANGLNANEFPSDQGIKEPAVYAGLPTEWLGACLLRTRATKLLNDTAWKWFDDFFLGSSKTAVNEVPKEVTERITYVGQYEPWLFDRAMTLFGIYIRTGDVKWLRHAHRAAQYFAKHLTAKGYFDLRNNDLKYSYNQSIFLDLLLTGDTSHLTKIKQVATAGSKWNAAYKTSMTFWTERHQTYALLAALTAWEATGEKGYADRVKTIVNATFAHAKTPPDSSWPKDGCLLHEFYDHEGDGGKEPICSPWMSALLADAVWRYYIHSQDKEALIFLANLGVFIQKHALYLGKDGLNQTVPWYLVSSVHQYTDGGPYDDLEHTCDVTGILARGAWAQKALGQNQADLLATANKLLASCKYNLNDWHRPQGPKSGKSEWRLDPPRKYNWWFGSTLDLEWLFKTAK